MFCVSVCVSVLIFITVQATAKIKVLTAPDRKTVNDLYPVRLCITFKRQRKYFSLKEHIKNNKWMFLSEDDIKSIWPENKQQSPRGKFKDIRNEYNRILSYAEDIINTMSVFSFSRFEHAYSSRTDFSWGNFYTATIDHVQTLKLEESYSYASTFEGMMKAVKEFQIGKKLVYKSTVKAEDRYKDYLKDKPLYFVDITPTWLKKFEKALQKEGKSSSTIGIYIRNIRTLFNIAIKKHKIKAEYPFHEYSVKKGSGRKMALSVHEISLIAGYETKDPVKLFHRDMFMFSFLANGMNMSDIIRLRYSNIIEDELYFQRKKTRNKSEYDEIRVMVTDRMKTIIDKYSVKTIGHDGYIFPVLDSKWTEEKKYRSTKQFIKRVNHYLKIIAREVKITGNISTYTARHSWATISKNSGVSTEYIKEALGHSNLRVTENYLKAFESTTRKEHADRMEKTIYNTG